MTVTQVVDRLRAAGGRALLLAEIAGGTEPATLEYVRAMLMRLQRWGLVRFHGGTDRWSLVEPEASEWLQRQTGSSR